MKNWFRVGLLLMLLPLLLCACGGRDSPPMETDGDSLRVVTTIFPLYDWTRQILREEAGTVELTLLLDDGVDLHSFQPTVDDMVQIAECDLFVYVGGESDEWVEDALTATKSETRVALNLMDVIGDRAREEEIVEGMQAEDDEEEEGALDEHIWLSLKNAALCCEAIAEGLCELDPDHADAYRENMAAYREELSRLDAQYESAVREASVPVLLFGDRFPFRYLTEDYHLTYYAAFAGCSAETEASFETVLFLAGKVDEWNLPAVLTLEKSDGRIARTVVENTAGKSAKILQMDSMQSTTAHDLQNGAAYLTAMEHNLEVLQEAVR